MNIEELKKQRKFKILLVGDTGSGKTYTAVKLAVALAKVGKKVKYIDTEFGATEEFILEMDGVDGKVAEMIEYKVSGGYKEIVMEFNDFEGFDFVVLDGLDDLYYSNVSYIENKIVEAGSYVSGDKVVVVKDVDTFSLPWNMYSAVYNTLSNSLYKLLNSNCNFIVCFKSMGTSDSKVRVEERIKAKFDTVIMLEKVVESNKIGWRGKILKNRGKPLDNMLIKDVVGSLKNKIGGK